MTLPHLLPAPPGFPPRQRPAEALNALAAQLPEGTRTTLRTDETLAVLSTPTASVWCNGRIFWWATADGARIHPRGWPAAAAAYISEHFAVLARQAGLPPVRFHDLRHGSASMLLAAGVPLKVVSQIMGHSTSAFTADVYVTVLEEMADAAAVAISAYVPRRASNVPAQPEGS